jgi:hypothetical protein
MNRRDSYQGTASAVPKAYRASCDSDPFAAAPRGEKGGGICCGFSHHNSWNGHSRPLPLTWILTSRVPHFSRIVREVGFHTNIHPKDFRHPLQLVWNGHSCPLPSKLISILTLILILIQPAPPGRKNSASAPRKAREGHDSSRAIKRPGKNPASAAEGVWNVNRMAEAGLVNECNRRLTAV